MTTGMVYLSFTETMQGGDVLVASMAIQSDGTAAPAASVPLAGTFVDVDALTVQFVLDTATLNALKKAENLATATSNTFISIETDGVKDMAANGIVAKVLVASTVGPDTTSPLLTSFDVDMATGQESLTITFDETIDRSSLAIEQITLVGNGGSHPLTSAASTSEDGTTIFVSIDTVDVDELKRKGICTTAAECAMSMSPTAITDMAGRALVQVTAQGVAAFGEDVTDPAVATFVKFDFDAAQLTLSFSEPVDPLTISAAAIRLDANNNVDSTNTVNTPLFHQLTSGTTASARGTSCSFVPSITQVVAYAVAHINVSSAGATVVIDLHIDDLNAIKRKPFLCKTVSNCFLRFSTQLIQDTFGNNVCLFFLCDVVALFARPKAREPFRGRGICGGAA